MSFFALSVILEAATRIAEAFVRIGSALECRAAFFALKSVSFKSVNRDGITCGFWHAGRRGHEPSASLGLTK